MQVIEAKKGPEEDKDTLKRDDSSERRDRSQNSKGVQKDRAASAKREGPSTVRGIRGYEKDKEALKRDESPETQDRLRNRKEMQKDRAVLAREKDPQTLRTTHKRETTSGAQRDLQKSSQTARESPEQRSQTSQPTTTVVQPNQRK